MCTKRCSKAEGIKNDVIKRALKVFTLTAHAEEGTEGNSTATQSSSATINYEQLIAAARKEEKDKLYPRIQKLEEENKKQVEMNNNNLIKIGDLMERVKTLEAENKSLKENVKDSDEVKSLTKRVAELEAENKSLKENAPDEKAIRAEIEKEFELKSYITEQKNSNKDAILSSFLDRITGTTKEEVDKSVADLKDETLSIKRDLGLVDDKGNPVEKKKTSDEKKSSGKTPKANPSADTGNTTVNYDLEYVRNLDPSSEEYKEFRKSLGLK